ncbi:MAG: hypothetical protein ACI9XO_002746 [Paraglaciecola sp.]|jgi:hypothetical protein
MKTIKIIILTAIFLFAFFANISTIQAQNNVLRVHPISGGIGYERLLAPNVSGSLTLKILPFGISFKDGDGNKISWKNYAISPEVRFYIKEDREKALAGFYLAPYLKAGLTTIEATVTSDNDLKQAARFNGHTFGIGATAGWQWVTPSGFSIGTAVGYGLSSFGLGDVEVTYSDGSTEKESFKNIGLGMGWPQLRFSLGYTF